MDIKGITLGKALRLRSTVANKIATASARARQTAISLSTDPKPDFDVKEQLKIFTDEQRNLRELKVKTTAKSLNTKVLIPEDIPVDEAGKEVPVYCAVLIRDDLKARKKLLDELIAMPVSVDRYEYYDTSEGQERPVKKRNFSFEEAIATSELLQESIDTIDGIIQGTDATVKFE